MVAPIIIAIIFGIGVGIAEWGGSTIQSSIIAQAQLEESQRATAEYDKTVAEHNAILANQTAALKAQRADLATTEAQYKNVASAYSELSTKLQSHSPTAVLGNLLAYAYRRILIL